MRIIRKPELFNIVGLSDSTVWRMERAGKFPRRIQLGAGSVGWIESEVEDWFSAKASQRTETTTSAAQ